MPDPLAVETPTTTSLSSMSSWKKLDPVSSKKHRRRFSVLSKRPALALQHQLIMQLCIYIYNIILDLKSCLEIFTDPWDSKNIFTTCVHIDMSYSISLQWPFPHCQADGETVLDKDVFSGLDQIAARQAADEAVAADPKAAANSQALEAVFALQNYPLWPCRFKGLLYIYIYYIYIMYIYT